MAATRRFRGEGGARVVVLVKPAMRVTSDAEPREGRGENAWDADGAGGGLRGACRSPGAPSPRYKLDAIASGPDAGA